MTERDFVICQALAYEGLANSDYSFVKDIKDTKAHFGTTESIALDGMWLAVWRDNDDDDYLVFYCTGNILPDKIMPIEDTDSKGRILLFKLGSE